MNRETFFEKFKILPLNIYFTITQNSNSNEMIIFRFGLGDDKILTNKYEDVWYEFIDELSLLLSSQYKGEFIVSDRSFVIAHSHTEYIKFKEFEDYLIFIGCDHDSSYGYRKQFINEEQIFNFLELVLKFKKPKSIKTFKDLYK